MRKNIAGIVCFALLAGLAACNVDEPITPLLARRPAAPDDDYIRLIAGGIMNSGLDLSIDLDTGAATKRTTPHGTNPQGENPNWAVEKRQLTSTELEDLRATISAGLVEGFKSQACIAVDEAAKQSGKPPPIRMPRMDSETSMYVRLGGQTITSPVSQCRSAAFDRVWEAAFHAASTI